MGDRKVDEIIEHWRSSARGAGDPQVRPRESLPRRAMARIGVPRALLALLVAAALAVIAVPVLVAEPVADPVPLPDPSTAGSATAPATPMAAPPSSAGAPAAEESGQRGNGPTVDDWYAILTEVDAARAAAYAAADPGPLRSAFAPDEPAADREERRVAALAEQGAVAREWRTDLLAVSPVEQDGARAVLRVRDRRGAYRLVDGQGTSTSVPAGDPSTWLVTLGKQGARWLVVDVLPEVTTPTGQP